MKQQRKGQVLMLFLTLNHPTCFGGSRRQLNSRYRGGSDLPLALWTYACSSGACSWVKQELATEKTSTRTCFHKPKANQGSRTFGLSELWHLCSPSGIPGVPEKATPKALKRANSSWMHSIFINIHIWGTAGTGTRPPQVLGLRWYLRCYSMKLHTTFEVPKPC